MMYINCINIILVSLILSSGEESCTHLTDFGPVYNYIDGVVNIAQYFVDLASPIYLYTYKSVKRMIMKISVII